jgi:cytochrome c-type biogenesis protein CcmH
MTWLRALLIALLLAAPVAALSPEEILPDPVLEQRARDISAGLRCLVCQNQSIDDSDADLARDLRLIVRERLVAGDSDEQVVQYVVDRYGEFVLLRPVLALHTVILWIAAPLILIIGILVLVLRSYRRTVSEVPLTPEEQAVLERLTKN